MMDAIVLSAGLASCAPHVHPTTAAALVSVESAGNPHAIGVVGGVLQRQPSSRNEAVATARALEATGWNFSVGLAQINRHNFHRLGLTLESAFDPCRNLEAMQVVLGECFQQAQAAARSDAARLRDALSCYYSGNFVTGHRHGYVRRVALASLTTPTQPVRKERT
jgi:type IV secretion system protein VirB1